MESVMEVLDASGHLTLSWDPEKPETVEKARAEFDRLRSAGFAFFVSADSPHRVKSLKTAALAKPGALDVRVDDEPVEQTREFRPRARRTVAVRPMRGG